MLLKYGHDYADSIMRVLVWEIITVTLVKTSWNFKMGNYDHNYAENIREYENAEIKLKW